jgi:hypothetical protein
LWSCSLTGLQEGRRGKTNDKEWIILKHNASAVCEDNKTHCNYIE